MSCLYLMMEKDIPNVDSRYWSFIGQLRLYIGFDDFIELNFKTFRLHVDVPTLTQTIKSGYGKMK